MLSYRQIYNCTKLLHSDYQDCKINAFRNSLSYLGWEIKNWKVHDIPHTIRVLKRKIDGTYYSKLKEVNLYLFSIEKYKTDELYTDYWKQMTIFTLFHELRHFQQDKYGKINRDSTDELERDCNRFASRMMNKYSVEISNILNVKNDWSFNL